MTETPPTTAAQMAHEGALSAAQVAAAARYHRHGKRPNDPTAMVALRAARRHIGPNARALADLLAVENLNAEQIAQRRKEDPAATLAQLRASLDALASYWRLN